MHSVVVKDCAEQVIWSRVIPSTDVVLLRLRQVGVTQEDAAEALCGVAEQRGGVGGPAVCLAARRVRQQEHEVGAAIARIGRFDARCLRRVASPSAQ
eukprot:6175249-Pleurochrysis_carterae.AAC.1